MNIKIINTDNIQQSNPIDDAILTVQYQTTFIPDTAKPEKPIDEMMMLKIGKRSSVYYSYAGFLSDSVLRNLVTKKASPDVITEQMKQYNSQIFAGKRYAVSAAGNGQHGIRLKSHAAKVLGN
jgi:GLPGLI family protein